MKKPILAAFVLLLAAAPALADTYIKSKSHTDAMEVMGQSTPARDETSETWIGPGRFATGTATNWFVVDVARKVAYFINRESKTYVEASLPVDLSKLLPPEAAAMASMIQVTATVTPTTDVKKIGSWNCTGYDAVMSVMGMQMNMRIWASVDVPFDVAAFNASIMPTVLQGQMRIADAAVAEFAKIKGYQIATEMSADIMGARLHTTQEVVEISERAAPEGTYAPPAGYKKNATLSLADLQRR